MYPNLILQSYRSASTNKTLILSGSPKTFKGPQLFLISRSYHILQTSFFGTLLLRPFFKTLLLNITSLDLVLILAASQDRGSIDKGQAK